MMMNKGANESRERDETSQSGLTRSFDAFLLRRLAKETLGGHGPRGPFRQPQPLFPPASKPQTLCQIDRIGRTCVKNPKKSLIHNTHRVDRGALALPSGSASIFAHPAFSIFDLSCIALRLAHTLASRHSSRYVSRAPSQRSPVTGAMRHAPPGCRRAKGGGGFLLGGGRSIEAYACLRPPACLSRPDPKPGVTFPLPFPTHSSVLIIGRLDWIDWDCGARAAEGGRVTY